MRNVLNSSRPLFQEAVCSGTPDIAWPCDDWLPTSTTFRYNRLGALAYQERVSSGPSVARDSLRYDRSGNQIERRGGFGTGSIVTTYIYPLLSNRVATRRDSIVGTAGHSDQSFSYDASGSRLLHVKGVGTGVDSTYWQYDALSRLVGTMRSIPGSPLRTRLEHYNECRWDAAWRLAQPCGASGQLSFVGSNVSHSSLGWFFVQAPGIDETVLMVDRNGSWFVNKRLQSVTDGRGQLIAVGDSSGDLTAPYAGSGYDQAAWQGGGLTSRAQTFDPRKWETSMDWGGIQQFRNRAYDPGTGTWIQEDPIGVAGGVNLYQYSNANPASFSDPFGMCPPKDDNYADCSPGTGNWYANRIATGQGSRVLNEIGGTLATCGESWACQGVLAVGGLAGVGVRLAAAGAADAAATGAEALSVGERGLLKNFWLFRNWSG